jgi:uncharacterized protein (TIGR00269 family)
MVKCRKCGAKAAINMRQHKLPLCAEHFIHWLPSQTQRTIEKYNQFQMQDRLLVAVSGGKDSLALWDVLLALGYKADGLYIDLGIDAAQYSDASASYAEAFARSREQKLIIVRARDHLGASIPDAALATRHGRDKPCSICGLTKRHLMNRAALEGEYDVLVTGHNLDDEAATLFGNTLNWQVGYLERQWPVLEGRPGFVRKAKPFCRIYERETAAYAFLRGIDYVHEECPYAEGAKSIYYKEKLSQMERERPGIKLSFYLSFLRAKQSMRFVEREAKPAFKTCPECGSPTTSNGRCSFCRIKARIRQPAETLERTS